MSIDRLIIDEYDIQENLHFMLRWRELSAPQVKSSYEDIPAAHGAVDTTEANGDVFYDMRDLALGCKYVGNDWQSDYDSLLAKFHGKKCKIVFGNDSSYYWAGRVFVSNYSSKERTLEMTGKVYPFKFAVDETIVEESVSGESEVILENSGRMTVVPTVTTDAEITLSFGTSSVTIQSGTYTVAGLEISGNDSETVTVQGTANVSFKYREGTL